jgi:Tfp pilus assembly protein PilO
MSKSPNVPSAMDGQRKLLWALAVSASCIFLAGAASLYLINNKIADEEKVVADKEAQVGSNEQIAQRYQSTLDTYNHTVDELKYLEPKMKHESYVATLIQQLQRNADAEGVKLISIRPGDETDPNPVKPAAAATDKPVKTVSSPYTQLVCSISVTGTYVQLMHFVYDLPHFPKILSVQNMSLSPANAALAPGTPQLTATIGLIAYIFDDNMVAPQKITSIPGVTPATPAVHNVSFNDNPVAFAAGRATSMARLDVKASNVSDRSGGLLDASTGSHSIQGGLGSEQQVPIR